MDLYAEHILDHFRSPRHKGEMEQATATHSELNPSCGDELTVQLKIDDGVITNILWDGTGCAISQAGMSMLAEEIIGKSVLEVNGMHGKIMLGFLGVPVGPRRMKCGLLALHTLKNALHLQHHEQLQGWPETMEGVAGQ